MSLSRITHTNLCATALVGMHSLSVSGEQATEVPEEKIPILVVTSPELSAQVSHQISKLLEEEGSVIIILNKGEQDTTPLSPSLLSSLQKTIHPKCFEEAQKNISEILEEGSPVIAKNEGRFSQLPIQLCKLTPLQGKGTYYKTPSAQTTRPGESRVFPLANKSKRKIFKKQ